MPAGDVRFLGWSIRGAVWRTVDPELQRRCFAARQAWNAEGSPSRFAYYNEDIEGYGAVRKNRITRQKKKIYVDKESAVRDVRLHLEHNLQAGRLIAWGRRASPLTELQPIPSTAWRAIHLTLSKRSIAKEVMGEKKEIFDVRIYPTVEAPDAIEDLADLPLADVLQRFVFSDPQVTGWCKRAKATGGQPLQAGHQRMAWQAIWPVDWGTGDGWRGLLELVEGSSSSEGATHTANLILGKRFARLIGYLADGRLEAEGIDKAGRSGVRLPRALWLHDRMHIDVNNGDLLEYRPDTQRRDPYFPMFTALTLRRPETVFHVKPIVSDPAPPNTMETGAAVGQRLTPKRASVEEAIQALWNGNIPLSLQTKQRDDQIIGWLRANGRSIVDPKTIARYIESRRQSN